MSQENYKAGDKVERTIEGVVVYGRVRSASWRPKPGDLSQAEAMVEVDRVFVEDGRACAIQPFEITPAQWWRPSDFKDPGEPEAGG